MLSSLRGSNETNRGDHVYHLLNACKEAIHGGLNLDNKETIAVDCDAFSFIISYDENTPQNRNAIKTLLLHFGSDWTTVTFPPIAAAIQTAKTGNQDSLFGSQHSKSCVEGIKDALHQSEVLIIDTPVKIALHASCRPAVKENIDRIGFAVRLSTSFGICFDHRKSTNKPSYGRIIDAILDSCHIDALNKHVIHIGNVGMRHPVVGTAEQMPTRNAGCQLQRLFKLIQYVRLQGIQVETTQVDIAFNIKYYDLVQFSSTQKMKNRAQRRKYCRQSVLSNLSPEVWPIHGLVTKESGGLAPERQQRGTLRVKRPKSDRSHVATVLECNMEDDHYLHHECDDQLVDLLQRIYSCQVEKPSRTQRLEIHQHAIHSIKFYSTLAHFLSPYKHLLPINRSTMNTLPACSMLKLQRFLDIMESLVKDSHGQLSQHGIQARIEVSVRPGWQDDTMSTNGALLRSSGHLVDLLSHVFAAIHDVLNHPKYKIGLETLSPRRVYAESLFLIRTVRSFVNMRAQTLFNEVYRDPAKHCWLRALVCLVMTKVGYAHDFKLSKIQQWLSSPDYFDPGKIGNSLESGLPLGILTSWYTGASHPGIASLSPTHHVIEHLSNHLKKIDLTPSGVDTIITAVCDNNRRYRLAYQKLSLLDKLRLAQHLNHSIIPNMGNLMTASNNPSNPNIESRDHVRGDTFGNESWSADWHHQYQESIDADWETSRMDLLHQFNSQHNLRLRSGGENTHPVMIVIESMHHFSKMFDPRNPTYVFQLFHYIELCHERSLELPCMMSGPPCYLQPLPQHSKSLISRLHNFLQFSSDKHVFIQQVCGELKISLPSRATPECMIASLCEHYLYPCLSANYDRLLCHFGSQTQNLCSVNPRTEGQLDIFNFLTLLASNKVFVRQLPSRDPTTMKFYRSIDEVYISIKKASELLKRGSHHHNLGGGTRHTNLFHTLQVMLNNNPSVPKRKGICHYLDEFLSKRESICDNFLTSDGNNDMALRNVVSLSQLEAKLGYTLADYPLGMQQQHITNYHPEIILPLSALMYKCHILYHDHDRSRTYFHFHHARTNKIVTYKFKSTTQMTAKVGCYVLHKISNTFQASQYSEPPEEISQRHIHWVFPQSLQVNIPTLKKHPLGKMNSHKNVPSCILRILRSPQVQHLQFINNTTVSNPISQNVDPFDIHLYLEELTTLQFSLEDLLDDNLSSIFKEMGIHSVHRIAQYVKALRNIQRPEYHNVLCPVLSLRHKLWFAVWHECHRRVGNTLKVEKATYLYFFHPTMKKACLFKLPQFIYIRNMTFIIYLRVLEKRNVLRRCNHWWLDSANPYNELPSPLTSDRESDLLLCKFSYLDGNLRQCVIQNLKLSYGSVSLMDSSDPNARPPDDDETHPFIATSSILSSTRNELLGHCVMAVFPFDRETRSYPVVFSHPHRIHNNTVRKQVTDIMRGILRDCIDNRIHLQLHSYSHESDLSTSFIQILYGFIMGVSNSVAEIQKRLDRVQTEAMLTQKTKEWVSKLCTNCLTSLEDLPIWLRQLLE